MNAVQQRKLELLSPPVRTEIDQWVAKYPREQKRSAVMAALRIVQEEQGSLTTDLMDAIAVYLEMEPISVYEVATFYSMYDLKPQGRHKISVCTNISCMLCGSADVMRHLQEKLGIRAGETTRDGKYTVREVECLGACAGAPMFQIGKVYYENLTPEKIDRILDSLE